MTTRTGGKNKSKFAVSRWKSTSGEHPAPKAPKAVTPPPPTATPPVSLSERLPGMSDAELLTLDRNAHRVAESDTDRKQAQAVELLPLIAAELDARKSAKAEASADKKKIAAAKRASTRAANLARKAEEKEAG
ncbi:MAG: hypothetical protein GC155_16230 [Alphaproteobacteria bacterium]|nr:hypothetical protein [Alphaproteobacteria bacterium]